MSLRSSNMAGNALGTAFSLLVLGSITKGLVTAEAPHSTAIEATVGQNVTLPCTIKNRNNLKLVHIEWININEEKKITKLAVYSPVYGLYRYWPNVTIQNEKIDTDELISFQLNMYAVEKWYSGIYICDIATFPLGSFRREVVLTIKDVDKIMCNVNSTVEVQNGENVTIRCTAFANALYKWTKNKKLVSEGKSLELWQVTDADTGVYSLTVSAGNKSLHKEFNITVFTVTTSLTTDLVTVSLQSTVTPEVVIDSADTSHTASLITDRWTVSTDTDVTDDTQNRGNVTITARGRRTDSHISVTSSPATRTDTYHLPKSTTLSYGSTGPRSTQETARDNIRNESTPHTGNPDEIFSVRPVKNVAKDNARSRLLVIIMIPLLVLITVVGFLYRRRVIEQRMDLPPPFKPPPPPVNYISVRQREISAKSFPISRCNSIQTYV